jgi:S-adenosylmethionine hydrolase
LDNPWQNGVIPGIQPRATVVDITHEIPASDLRVSTFALVASRRFLPKARAMWLW